MCKHFVVVKYASALKVSGFCKSFDNGVEKEGIMVIRL